MNVHWTETAEAHLDSIYTYIGQNSESYALRTIDLITKRSQQIGSFPFSGRRVPEFDADEVREVFEGAYRIIYYIKADQVDVIAVIHGAVNILQNEKL